MKWWLVAVAAVLGGVITWRLTVRRATRSPSESSPESSAQDEAAGFGGTPTPVSETLGAAEAWDRDAEDEDALLPREPDEPDERA